MTDKPLPTLAQHQAALLAHSEKRKARKAEQERKRLADQCEETLTRDAAAQMRAVAADIEDALLRITCDRETAETLHAAATSLVEWGDRLDAGDSLALQARRAES